MSWWNEDPVTITAMDEDDIWLTHPAPPMLVARTRKVLLDWDEIADTTARLLGYESSPVTAPIWVRMNGPIEYVRNTAMPVGLTERVERAVGELDVCEAFDVADEFGLLNRYVPKGVRYRGVAAQLSRLIVTELATTVVKVPRALPTLTRPTEPIRSAGPQVRS